MMESVRGDLRSLIVWSNPPVKNWYAEGYRLSQDPSVIRRHFSAPFCLVAASVHAFFESLAILFKNSFSPLNKEWVDDTFRASQHLYLVFVSAIFSLPSFAAPRWTFTWLVLDKPMLFNFPNSKEVLILQKEALRFRKRANVFRDQNSIQRHLIQILIVDQPENKRIIEINLRLIDEIAKLRAILAEKEAENYELDQGLECMYDTLKGYIKIFGNPRFKMICVHGENGAGQIFLNTFEEYERLIEMLKEGHAEQFKEEAKELPVQRRVGGRVRVRGTLPSEFLHQSTELKKRSISQLRQAAAGLPDNEKELLERELKELQEGANPPLNEQNESAEAGKPLPLGQDVDLEGDYY